MTCEVTIISRTHRKINDNYYARVRYRIGDGRPLDILRRVENKSAIKPKQAEIEVELLKNGPAQLAAGKVTFRQLAQHAKDNIYVSGLPHTPKQESRKVHASSTLCVTTSVLKWLMKACRYQRWLIC